MEHVTRDVYAESTIGPMQGKLSTIVKFLACWGLQLLPYTAEVVYALGAALKWRGYRSADNYLYLSKTVAEREGATLDAATRRALKDVIRSCKRGLGPSKRCEGLILEIMPDLPAAEHSWCAGGPWRPRETLILGAWWMLREVELSNAELRSVSFNHRLLSASWTLPASKTDVSALGETVSHGCSCRWTGSRRTAHPLCPFHLLLEHVRAMYRRFRDRFDEEGWALPGYPLFPDRNGDVCTKAGVTDTKRKAAQLLGHALVDPGGLFLHSGHALRVTGAQALARAGVSEHTIALIARWGSATVLLYIRKAPLAASHHLAAVAVAGWQRNRGASSSAAPFSGTSVVRSVAPHSTDPVHCTVPAGEHAALRGVVKALDQRLSSAEAQLRDLTEWRNSLTTLTPVGQVVEARVVGEVVQPTNADVDYHFPFVRSIREVTHKVRVGYPNHPHQWRARCGWQFGLADVAVPLMEHPTCHKSLCDRCFKTEKKAARAAALVRVREVGVDAE